MLVTVFTLLLVLSFAPSAWAQADSLASVQGELYPYAKRSGTSNDQIGVSIFRASLGFPIFLSKKTLLIPTLGYERFEASIRSPSGNQSLLLQAPSLTMMLLQPLTERITLMGSVGVGFASDFSAPLSEQDLLLSGMLVGIYKFSDSFSLGTGVSYDRRSGNLLPVPLGIMRWQMSENARLIGAIPATLSFEYRVTPWLSSGFRAAFNGNRYHFGEGQFQQERLQLAYSNVVLGPKLVFSVGDWIHLEAYAAVTAYRRYDVYSDRDSVAELNLGPTMGYGLRMWIGPSFWKNASPTQ
ncbi:hypothetical protein AKJ09_07117 [Labilithrix luteola]|uniref:DUF6268 domain-containing protein n=1 Tax=Labilithrix luteola TaxID=1391654 RepID=A0A0K1Q3Z8_9BACT|nr:hypothetical protein AKJ09_07117 [Labilithrix luteola]